jgi:hypothetical protein
MLGNLETHYEVKSEYLRNQILRWNTDAFNKLWNLIWMTSYYKIKLYKMLGDGGNNLSK